jgi:threonine/homoserine/homoserine lactone efflux protein
MDPILSLFSILAALALGAISPGPSFLFVTRTSVALSRRDGIAAALGMGLGAAFLCALALIGLRAVIAQVEWVYIGFKVLGGAYLLTLAWRLWRGAAPSAGAPPQQQAQAERPQRGLARSFLLALATQLSNPKTVVVISGIFAALLPAHVPVWMLLAIPPIQFVIESSWYAFVAMVMSSPAPRSVYLRAQTWIDRAAGCVLGALGLRLILEGAKEAG